MHARTRTCLTAMLAVVSVSTFAMVADAKCTRLGFSVNDYGKDGPTKDAQRLLDTYIAKWAADNGVKKYSTGRKDVKCELFLDVGLFDEHTCRAEATVCWGTGGPVTTDAAAAPAVPKPAATRPAAAKPASVTPAAATTAPASAPAAAPPAAPAAPPAAPKNTTAG